MIICSPQEFYRYLPEIQEVLGHKIHHPELLLEAFVHSSFVHEWREPILSNERLEFLGDAVLGLIVSAMLFEHFPKEKEGRLSAMRASLVDAEQCARWTQELHLDRFLLVGKGELLEGRGKLALCADLFEAVVGALFLDGGWPVAYRFLEKFIPALLGPSLIQHAHNPKSKLQEILQARGREAPIYKMIDSWGPDHAKNFRVAVFLDNECLGEGEGDSKKRAELEAAKSALAFLSSK